VGYTAVVDAILEAVETEPGGATQFTNARVEAAFREYALLHAHSPRPIVLLWVLAQLLWALSPFDANLSADILAMRLVGALLPSLVLAVRLETAGGGARSAAGAGALAATAWAGVLTVQASALLCAPSSCPSLILSDSRLAALSTAMLPPYLALGIGLPLAQASLAAAAGVASFLTIFTSTHSGTPSADGGPASVLALALLTACCLTEVTASSAERAARSAFAQLRATRKRTYSLLEEAAEAPVPAASTAALIHLLERAETCLLEVDVGGLLRYVSPAARWLLGISDEEDALATEALSWVHPFDRILVHDAWIALMNYAIAEEGKREGAPFRSGSARNLATPLPWTRLVFRRAGVDGRVRWVDCHTTIVLHAPTALPGVETALPGSPPTLLLFLRDGEAERIVRSDGSSDGRALPSCATIVSTTLPEGGPSRGAAQKAPRPSRASSGSILIPRSDVRKDAAAPHGPTLGELSTLAGGRHSGEVETARSQWGASNEGSPGSMEGPRDGAVAVGMGRSVGL